MNWRQNAKKPASLPAWERAGSLGELEQMAGITDRVEFWRAYSKLTDTYGFERGVKELKARAKAKAEGAML